MEWFVMGDLIIPQETQRKSMIQSVHDDIQCGVAVIQKSIKLDAWWLWYSRDIEKYIKCCKKCKELRNFTQTTLHSWHREKEPCAYRSCIHYWSGALINTRRLSFRLAWSNPRATQENFYDKTDSKSHIFKKRYTKNPGIQQCTRILRCRS